MSNNSKETIIPLYSYSKFIKERKAFKEVDRIGVNRYDTPSALFFKILFYFSENHGLLGGVNGNSAISYLVRNCEYERAELLNNFKLLLSNINTLSPWYFQEITGLDTALERKIFSDKVAKIEEDKELTIKCLADAYDNRISALLEMYRLICYSYKNKKEIVPANLRKFNMGILVFNAPILGINKLSDANTAELKNVADHAKLIEFQNCEIDYNSLASGFASMNTTEGPVTQEYTIKIKYNECFETRYNDVLGLVISDFIKSDIEAEVPTLKNPENKDSDNKNTEIDANKAADSEPKEMVNPQLDVTNVNKSFWTNTNAADDKYKDAQFGLNEARKFEMGSFDALRPFTSFVKARVDDVKELLSVPHIATPNTDNIHDNWTSNQQGRYGKYEYLNRIDGLNGILGTLATTAVGSVVNPIEDKLKQLYLGNIRGATLDRNLLAESDNLGNIRPQKEDTETLKTDLGKLPGYITNRSLEIGNTTKAKSLRNNI